MVYSWFGGLFKVTLLLINAMAILNEERFLARIGWTAQAQQAQPAFAQPYDPYTGMGGNPPEISITAKLVNLITAVRTLMRGM
ncbi:Yos1-like protein [Fomitiporia mediterranea MF3/22]|uniref:Yos1-like protein n=1 Tax=Fomitiporia mediterranea (strain MF3/22) TaxID=694068 RepID=UPI0004409B1F|nr:Yos1-like protein [Fomitiporia mediterranea MF3/22]EJD01496.1 Yos1-like protein [Fomitiporia mediterranea MF3/22]